MNILPSGYEPDVFCSGYLIRGRSCAVFMWDESKIESHLVGSKSSGAESLILGDMPQPRFSTGTGVGSHAFSLVIIRHQHSCRRPISLGDDPKLDCIAPVHRQQPKPRLKGQFIFEAVLSADLAPVSCGVAIQGCLNVNGCQLCHCIGGCDDLTERKFESKGDIHRFLGVGGQADRQPLLGLLGGLADDPAECFLCYV